MVVSITVRSAKRNRRHTRLHGLSAHDPAGYLDGLSLYQYVQSDPTTYTDPMGLCEVPPNTPDGTTGGQTLQPPCAGGGVGEENPPVVVSARPIMRNEPVNTKGAILTFDDGPIADDWWSASSRMRVGLYNDPKRKEDPCYPDEQDLLQPLYDILTTLKKNDLQAVFYVVGSTNVEADPHRPHSALASPQTIKKVWDDGIKSIAAMGDVLGLHATNHNMYQGWPLSAYALTHDVRGSGVTVGTLWNAVGSGAQLAAWDIDHLYADLKMLNNPAVDAMLGNVWRMPFGFHEMLIQQMAIDLLKKRIGISITAHHWGVDSDDWWYNENNSINFLNMDAYKEEGAWKKQVAHQLVGGMVTMQGEENYDILFHVTIRTANNLGDFINMLRDGHQPLANAVPPNYLPTRAIPSVR